MQQACYCRGVACCGTSIHPVKHVVTLQYAMTCILRNHFNGRNIEIRRLQSDPQCQPCAIHSDVSSGHDALKYYTQS